MISFQEVLLKPCAAMIMQVLSVSEREGIKFSKWDMGRTVETLLLWRNGAPPPFMDVETALDFLLQEGLIIERNENLHLTIEGKSILGELTVPLEPVTVEELSRIRIYVWSTVRPH